MNSTLQTLDLFFNFIDEGGGQAIGKALGVNKKLQTLNLRRNDLGEEAGQAIGEA
jgi:hypothetical protein